MKAFLLVSISSVAWVVSGCSDPENRCPDIDCDDQNVCTLDSCEPETVECQSVPVSDGITCALDAALGVCEAGACIEDTSGENPREGFPGMGRVTIHLEFTAIAPADVFLEANCAGWIMKARFFPTTDGRWRLVGPLPSGTCEGRFVATDANGETICTSSTTFDVSPTAPTGFDETLTCDQP